MVDNLGQFDNNFRVFPHINVEQESKVVETARVFEMHNGARSVILGRPIN